MIGWEVPLPGGCEKTSEVGAKKGDFLGWQSWKGHRKEKYKTGDWRDPEGLPCNQPGWRLACQEDPLLGKQTKPIERKALEKGILRVDRKILKESSGARRQSEPGLGVRTRFKTQFYHVNKRSF